MGVSRREFLVALGAATVSGGAAWALRGSPRDCATPPPVSARAPGPADSHVQLLASAAATGMAVVTDEKYAGGADPSWQSDSTDAFRAAAATTLPVYVPPGAYRFAGPGIDVEAPTFIGAGQGFTTISLRDSSYFIESNRRWKSLTVSGIRFDGGLGHIRNTYTGANVNDQFTVTDCVFNSYKRTSIGHHSSDHPYWKIERNIFRYDGYRSTTGISLSGLTDGTSIRDNAFHANRVHVALAQGGNNVYFENNDFLRFGPTQGHPRVDIWMKPAATGVNSGQGLTVRSCKFGNENVAPTDLRIVYADDTDGFPYLTGISTGWIGGHTIADILVNGIGDEHRIPVIRSTTSNIVGGRYGPITIAGSTGIPIISTIDPLSRPKSNIVGPQLRANASTAAMPAMVVSDR